MIVYSHTNKVNGKVYVGRTTRSFEIRWKEHVYDSYIPIYPFHKAIKKYGPEAFIGEILCECFSLEELNRKELEFAEKLNAFVPYGYTCRAGTGVGTLREETKKKLSELNSGDKHPKFGKKDSVETKLKKSLALRGKPKSEEHRRKVSIAKKEKPSRAFLGRHHTDEVKKTFADLYAKTWSFISPSGEPITFINLHEFCREHTYLDRSALMRVHSGKVEHHKGWRKAI